MIGIIGQYCTTSLEKQRWKILYQKNTKNVYITFQQKWNMYEKVTEENMAQKTQKLYETFQKQRNMYEWSYGSKICF